MTKMSTDPYTRLFNAFLDAYSSTNTKKWCQDEANKSWKEIKEMCSKAAERSTHLETEIKELKAISMKRKGANMTFWASIPKSNSTKPITSVDARHEELEFQPNSSQFEEVLSDQESLNPQKENSSTASSSTALVKHQSRAQEELRSRIAVLDADLVGLFTRR